MKHRNFHAFVIVLSLLVCTPTWAADYFHLIDGSIDLANLKIEPESRSETKQNTFELSVNYRNQIQPSLYLVTNFEFSDTENLNLFSLGFGAEKNLFGGNPNVEIGPGAILTYSDGEYGTQDYNSYGIMPYAFIRSFIGGSRAYIMWTLGYELTFAERESVDEDVRGVNMSFGFGLAF